MALQISRLATWLKGPMTIAMATLLCLIGFSGQVLAQTPAKGIEGSWQGTLDAGGTQLRLVLKVTKSEAGPLTAELVSLDQGSASIPVDTITVKVDSVRLEMRAIGATFVGVLNQERTELAGTFAQGGQELPLRFTRDKQAAAVPPPPTPTPLAPKRASRANPVGAIVTIIGSGPQGQLPAA